MRNFQSRDFENQGCHEIVVDASLSATENPGDPNEKVAVDSKLYKGSEVPKNISMILCLSRQNCPLMRLAQTSMRVSTVRPVSRKASCRRAYQSDDSVCVASSVPIKIPSPAYPLRYRERLSNAEAMHLGSHISGSCVQTSWKPLSCAQGQVQLEEHSWEGHVSLLRLKRYTLFISLTFMVILFKKIGTVTT